MKKILFLLILVYNYSFSAWETYSCGSNLSFINSGPVLSGPSSTSYSGCQRNYSKSSVSVTYGGLAWSISLYSGTGQSACTSTLEMTDGIMTCTENNKLGEFIPNPDPLGGSTCRDLFQKDGVAYTCNPNTNEATPIENSDGVINDPEMGDVPNCSDGYSPVATQNIPNTGTTEGMYNSWSCESNSGTGDGGSNGDDTGTPTPTITTNPDGSKSWTLPDGTNLNLTTNGTLTTTYPDGSSTVSQVGTNYDPITGSTSGSGSSTGGGGGTNGNTTNEDNTSSNNDTPVDETPVSNSCNDSSLTLQEKMMCEMNAGIKKLNSESTPENSLNNLLKDMNKDNNTNLTAINTNIKDTKALNENQLAELKKMTSELKKLNGDSTSQSTITQPITDNFTPDPNAPDVDNPIDNNLIDSFLGIYSDFNTNISQKVETLNNLITSSQNTISQGLSFSMFQSEIVNCPQDFQLDLSSLGQGQINMNIDFCQYTSQLKPFIYPILLITMSLGVIFFAFRFIGVLI